jgi:MFS transporter, PPP family, 3-phenylpropionic acid transporter
MVARIILQNLRPPIVLAIFYAAHFVGFGFHLPFLPVWLASKGLGSIEIGFVLSLQIAVRVIVTAPMTALADKHVHPRTLLLFCNGVACVAFAAMAFVDGLWLITALAAVSAIALAPTVPLCDLMTLAAARKRVGVDYGVTRVFGSVAFLAATLGGGVLLDILDPVFIVIAMAICSGLAALSTLLPISDDKDVLNNKDILNAQLPLRPDVPHVMYVPLLNSCLIWVICGTAAVQASHAVLYSFGALHWKSQGYGGDIIGMFWALGVLSEIVLFARLGRHIGSVRMGFWLVAVGAALAACRFVVMGFDPPTWLVIPLQIMHAGSFGATHLGAMSLLAAMSPEGARAAWQGRIAAANAFAMALATAASGPLYRSFGELAYVAMTPVALIGLGMIVIAWRLYPQSFGAGGNTRLPS